MMCSEDGSVAPMKQKEARPGIRKNEAPLMKTDQQLIARV
jgi:hypothetical protein